MEPSFEVSGTAVSKAGRSLEGFSSDILLLIFEEIFHSAPESLQSLRFLSRSLNVVITPFRYRFVELNSKLVTQTPDACVTQAWKHIHRSTRHIAISSELDWDLAVKLLLGCVRLDRIDWSWWGGGRRANEKPMPPVFQRAIREQWSAARLHIIDYPWPDDWNCREPFYPFRPSTSYERITPSIPRSNIVYISTRHNKRHSNFEQLGKLAAQSSNLETLELHTVRPKLLSGKERLPPIKQLILRNCHWPYSAEECYKTWNFSRLETLIFHSSSVLLFFNSLKRDSLSSLKTLKVDPDSYGPYFEGIDGPPSLATLQLNHFIDRACSLRELDIRCSLQSLSLPSILIHGSSLETLGIRDNTWYHDFQEDHIVCPTLSLTDLMDFRISCPLLRDVTLDLDWRLCNVYEFVEAIARFRNLQKLTLRILLEDCSDHDRARDSDLEAAYALRSHLTKTKVGLPIISLTFNVCGWNRQLQQGRLPHRLLVFSQGADGCLELKVSR